MDFRQCAIGAYYYASLPLRARARRQMERAGTAPLCVLFYHRVANDHPNPWSISPGLFRRQIHWLNRYAEIVPLDEIQQRMRDGFNDRIRVAITFDDGYADNCEHAIPFLIEHQIPTTYFVTLEYVVEQTHFPHDIETGRPLQPNTIDQIRYMADQGIEIGAHTRTHCNVGAIDSASVMIDEVVTATEELSDLIDRPIRYFAFPYGQVEHLSAAAVQLARRAGIQGVCSAYGAYNYPGDDPFHLQRFHADPDFIRLKNWVSIDPRKKACGRDFQFPETAVRVQDLPQPPSAPTAPIAIETLGLGATPNALPSDLG